MNFIQPTWPAPKQIKAYSTVRSSWGGNVSNSKSAFSDQVLKSLLQLPDDPIWLTQTHSTTAIEATSANKGLNADASFTSEANHVCAVLTADCLPLLICNKSGTFVAAIHAGWRGLANGIIESTLKAATVPTQDLLVWLGPAIGPNKFEVGKDVFDVFTAHNPKATSAFKATSDEKWHANLYDLARQHLQSHGITQIYGGDFCTHTQEDLFFSYRREGGRTGSIASLIWIAA